MIFMHQENLRAIEAQNQVLNDLQKNQVENQQIMLMTSNGEGHTDSNSQAKLHTILQQKISERETRQIVVRTSTTKRGKTFREI